MIVVDTSVFVAIFQNEPESNRLIDALERTAKLVMFKGNDFSRTDIASALV